MGRIERISKPTQRGTTSRNACRSPAVLLILGVAASSYYHLLIRACPKPMDTSIHSSTSPSVERKKMVGLPLLEANNNNTKEVLQFQLAHDQSFGFFHDISDYNWNHLRQIYLKNKNHLNPERPYMTSEVDPSGRESWWRSSPAWYQNNYEPNFSCQMEMRIGKNMNGDGPKWVCDPHRIRKLAAARKQQDPSHPGCVVYSIGSAGDFNFEMGMEKEMGEGVCEFHIFDPGNFGHKVPRGLKRATYHQWGLTKQQQEASGSGIFSSLSQSIWGPPAKQEARATDYSDICPSSTEEGKSFCGLQDTIKQLGHDKLDVIDVFKIDCEGCEWDTFHDWIADDIPLLHQIQVEVHGVKEGKTVDFFDELQEAGYLTFHKEPNIQFNPSCVEYAFVKVEKAFIEGKDFAM